ncbi:hypothetical protein CBS101457_006388 [Exobasidium rhododendri]|nr:hypothetical protein CBS101457_006388 [Exobasidium rhododendri]
MRLAALDLDEESNTVEGNVDKDHSDVGFRLTIAQQAQSDVPEIEVNEFPTSLSEPEPELDKFAYENESESDTDVSQAPGHTKPLRRLLHLRASHRRGNKETIPTRRSGSIVRITSFDPRSNLSSSPIQVAKDAPDETLDTAAVSLVQHSGSAARRRRESGRLAGGLKTSSTSSRYAASPSRNNISRSASPLHSASPLRPVKSQQRRSVHTNGGADVQNLSLSPDVANERDDDDWSQSPTSSASHSFASANSDDVASITILPSTFNPPSILKQKAEPYASIPDIMANGREEASQGAWDGASWHGGGREGADGHHSNESRGSFENDFSYMIPPSPITPSVSRLPPGAGHALPSSTSRRGGLPSLRLGLLTAEQARAIWPEKRLRSIRLQEPDWAPYVDIHDRARERFEAAAHISAKQRSFPSSSIPLSTREPSTSSIVTSLERGCREAEILEQQLAEARRGEGEQEEEGEGEFWFERYSQSTAAAGRDWDWRKRRRARQMAAATTAAAAAAAAIETAIETEIASPMPRLQTPVNGLDSSTPERTASVTPIRMPKQQQEQANRVKQAEEAQEQQQHLMKDLTSQHASNETLAKPPPFLSVITSDSYLLRGKDSTNKSSPKDTQNSSPLGKIIRLKKNSNVTTPEASLLDDRGRRMFEDSSTDVTSSPLSPELLANGESKRFRIRRSLDSFRKEEAAEAVSVPSRFSSLKPKIMKRNLSARRIRDAAITAQLLAEAEDIATDEEDAELLQKDRFTLRSNGLQSRPYSQRQQLIRKSASSTILRPRSSDNELGTTSAAPRSSADFWTDPEEVWSSANAYGATTMSQPRRSLDALPLHSLPRQPSVPAYMGRSSSNGSLSNSLVRQESKTDSQSSSSSNTKQGSQDIQTNTPWLSSGSRKAILSSAIEPSIGAIDFSSRRPFSEETSVLLDQTMLS